jgi:predicted metalloprotease with PDZ domain
MVSTTITSLSTCINFHDLGPADQAGLVCGDIVLSWDGVQVKYSFSIFIQFLLNPKYFYFKKIYKIGI